MFALEDHQNIYIAQGVIDLRKSVTGLSALVIESFGQDPFDQNLYVFCNRARDRLKILQWDVNGFWLYSKVLDHGRFSWEAGDNGCIAITSAELRWLVHGSKLSPKAASKRSLY